MLEVIMRRQVRRVIRNLKARRDWKPRSSRGVLEASKEHIRISGPLGDSPGWADSFLDTLRSLSGDRGNPPA